MGCGYAEPGGRGEDSEQQEVLDAGRESVYVEYEIGKTTVDLSISDGFDAGGCDLNADQIERLIGMLQRARLSLLEFGPQEPLADPPQTPEQAAIEAGGGTS